MCCSTVPLCVVLQHYAVFLFDAVALNSEDGLRRGV